MAKTRKGSKENPISLEELNNAINNLKEKEYRILEASIKDDFCNYKFEMLIGVKDKHKVEGKGIIKDTLRDAFRELNVHLAAIDDVFKHAGLNTETKLKELKEHELTDLYHVTGFKISGSGEAEFIQLIGNKYVSSASGRIEITTPKIALDNLSSYRLFEELKEAADDVRHEVELYKEGNYIEPEEEDDSQAASVVQMTISDGIAAAKAENEKDILDPDFEEAKL